MRFFAAALVCAALFAGLSDASRTAPQDVAIGVQPVALGNPVTDLEADLEAHFKAFVHTHNKNYLEEEWATRLGVFKANVLKMREHQKNDPGATYGVNQFAAHTEEEFKSLLGTKQRSSGPKAVRGPTLPTADLPLEYDWRTKGAVTPVKNQGMCGSCWAFSTTGAVEGAYFLKTGKLMSLSEQELVDCDHTCDPEEPEACDSGCDGGLMENALTFVEKTGLDTEDSYPYTSKGGSVQPGCKEKEGTVGVASISNYTIIPKDEEQIKAYLVKNGPVSIAIHADLMQFYIKGVSCPYLCSKIRLDHGMLLVGYGQDGYAPSRLKQEPFWIIKNSWSDLWGESGYIRMCEGFGGKCGLAEDALSVVA